MNRAEQIEARRALETMLTAAVRFAAWGAGQGIAPHEDEADQPEEFLLAYSEATGDEHWETLADRMPGLLAALRSTPEGGDQGAWRPTGSSTCRFDGTGTQEWFRTSDGQVRSYPFGFDPNVGAYVGMSFRSTPQPHSHTEEERT